MADSICGADCTRCAFREGCGGCTLTGGRPFGGDCLLAACCQRKGLESCGQCGQRCQVKEALLAEFNALGIAGMKKVTDLNALKGSFVNLPYTLPNGQTVQLLEDEKIYLGNQICQEGSNRCYGLAADEHYLLVCAYGDNGADAEIVVYKKRGRG